MNAISLPGIYKIGKVPTANIPINIVSKCMAGIPVGLFCSVENITFYGEATCEMVSEAENNGYSEKTTLKFRTSELISTTERVAFVVDCASDERFLIGSREHPYPVVKITKSTGSPSGDASCYEVEVTFTSVKSLIPIKK